MKTAVWSPLIEFKFSDLNNIKKNHEENKEGEKLTKIYQCVEVKVRSKVCHSFNAELQRMTVIAEISRSSSVDSKKTKKSPIFERQSSVIGSEILKQGGIMIENYGSKDTDKKENVEDNHVEEAYLIACKGSPESVFTCLGDKQRLNPQFESWYYNEYKKLAREGKRVISFASKEMKYYHHNYSVSMSDISHHSLGQMTAESVDMNASSRQFNDSNYIALDHNVDLMMSDAVNSKRESGKKNQRYKQHENGNGNDHSDDNENKNQDKNENENENENKNDNGNYNYMRKGMNGDYKSGEDIWASHLLESSRGEVERNLEFQGFVSFACPLRCVFD